MKNRYFEIADGETWTKPDAAVNEYCANCIPVYRSPQGIWKKRPDATKAKIWFVVSPDDSTAPAGLPTWLRCVWDAQSGRWVYAGGGGGAAADDTPFFHRIAGRGDGGAAGRVRGQHYGISNRFFDDDVEMTKLAHPPWSVFPTGGMPDNLIFAAEDVAGTYDGGKYNGGEYFPAIVLVHDARHKFAHWAPLGVLESAPFGPFQIVSTFGRNLGGADAASNPRYFEMLVKSVAQVRTQGIYNFSFAPLSPVSETVNGEDVLTFRLRPFENGNPTFQTVELNEITHSSGAAPLFVRDDYYADTPATLYMVTVQLRVEYDNKSDNELINFSSSASPTPGGPPPPPTVSNKNIFLTENVRPTLMIGMQDSDGVTEWTSKIYNGEEKLLISETNSGGESRDNGTHRLNISEKFLFRGDAEAFDLKLRVNESFVTGFRAGGFVLLERMGDVYGGSEYDGPNLSLPGSGGVNEWPALPDGLFLVDGNDYGIRISYSLDVAVGDDVSETPVLTLLQKPRLAASNEDAANITSFAIVRDELPPGLELNAETGEITGEPTEAGSGNFRIDGYSSESNFVAKGSVSWTVS